MQSSYNDLCSHFYLKKNVYILSISGGRIYLRGEQSTNSGSNRIDSYHMEILTGE